MANEVCGRVCKPDCEYGSDAPLSIKRFWRHRRLVNLFIGELFGGEGWWAR